MKAVAAIFGIPKAPSHSHSFYAIHPIQQEGNGGSEGEAEARAGGREVGGEESGIPKGVD